MKKLIMLIMFFADAFVLAAQNFSLDGKYFLDLSSTLNSLVISNNEISYDFWKTKEKRTVRYEITHTDGLAFIKMSEKFPKEFSEEFYSNKNIVTDDKILILAGKKKNSNEIILFGTTGGFYDYRTFIVPFHFEVVSQSKDCSSYLKEKNKEYPVTNLSKFDVETPWVEGVNGYGIGESFTIDNSWSVPRPYLFIMNGYISYKKPYLYKQNGRIKKIKVKGLKSGKEKILDVLDTPHPQTVDISFITEPEDIRVTIEEVYPGTKYEDTCIHYMITYFDEVIPYENSIGGD